MRQAVAQLCFSIAMILSIGMFAFALACGNPFKGRRTLNRALRRVYDLVPGGELARVAHADKNRAQVKWPLWFGQSESGEPPGWLVAEVSYTNGIDLLISGIDDYKNPQRVRSWCWRRWPRPYDSVMIEKRSDMAAAVTNYIKHCLDPAVQARFPSPRAMFDEARNLWTTWWCEREREEDEQRKAVIAQAILQLQRRQPKAQA